MKDLDTERILKQMAMNQAEKKDVEGCDENDSIYTSGTIKMASLYIRALALSHEETEQEVRAGLMDAIQEGMNNHDPEVRQIWDTFKYMGDKPTPEEFLLWFYEVYSAAIQTI